MTNISAETEPVRKDNDIDGLDIRKNPTHPFWLGTSLRIESEQKAQAAETNDTTTPVTEPEN